MVYLGDDQLDLFFFFGSSKEILSEYTALTGRAPLPPLWTFGLWMGRRTYSSEGEVREVAKKLRRERIPSEVIHLDTDGPRSRTAATSSSPLWSDYQRGETYEGARWHHEHAGEAPIVMLVRDGAAIPHAGLAQSTGSIEWGQIELRIFGSGESAEGYFCHPEDGGLQLLRLVRADDGFELGEDPLGGRVKWRISTAP